MDEASESGFAKITIREAETYQEGVDAQGNEVVLDGRAFFINPEDAEVPESCR